MSKMIGKVDLLGLDQFGENPGLSPLWGTAIGGGSSWIIATGLQHGARAGSGLQRNANLVGMLTGFGITGALWAMKSTRHAAFGSLLGVLFATGLKWLEGMLFGSPSAQSAMPPAPGTKGVGLPTIVPLNGGLGLPTIQPLNGNFGLPQIQEKLKPHGTIPGVAGAQLAAAGGRPPVNLLGLSARYGATLLGGR